MYDRKAARLARRETYGGFDSLNALHVHHYIQNNNAIRQGLEGIAMRQGVKNGSYTAARAFRGYKTPEGSDFNVSALRAAMRGMGERGRIKP
tara:strand:- start:284 stop:559 length:276 start_codon:yes stop_codon:yes gene_type:complete